jgi:pyridoxamine 5'-phosphate oxidase
MAEQDPLTLFLEWFAEAERAESDLPEAAHLATATAEGRPSGRVVLVRPSDGGGFEFHTNTRSQKGRELAENPFAALVWHWKSLGRQVRMEGTVAPLSDAESDAYWNARAKGSQISAMLSDQSEPIGAREELEQRHRELESRFGYFPVPRPSHWGGYRLTPDRYEFWMHREDRLHERLAFSQASEGGAWQLTLLQP